MVQQPLGVDSWSLGCPGSLGLCIPWGVSRGTLASLTVSPEYLPQSRSSERLFSFMGSKLTRGTLEVARPIFWWQN